MPYTDLIARPSTLGREGSSDGRAAEVQDVVTQLRRDFAERDALYERYENTLNGLTPVKIPAAYDKTATVVRTPMAAHIVNSIVAALSVNAPTVQFQPTGFGNAPTENATSREKFFEASWLRQEREAKRRLFRLFMYSLVAKGEGILKTTERVVSAWGPYREYGREAYRALARDRSLDHDARERLHVSKMEQYKRDHAPYPITTTDVLPETFYYLKGQDGFTLCAEVKDVPYLDTLVRYGMGLDGRGYVVPQALGLPLPEWQNVMRGAGSVIKMHEVWTAGACTYVLCGPGQVARNGSGRDAGRGTVVKTLGNHGYGNPDTQTLWGPYFHALGTTTASRLPHRTGLGVLHGFLDLFPLLDSLVTIAHNNAVMTGFASFKKKRPASEQAIRPRGAQANPYGEDGDEDDEDEEVIEPGYVYPDDIEPIEMPRAGVDFDKFIAMVKQFLDLALPPAAQGQANADTSGYAFNQMAHLSRLAWDPILDNAEFALSDRVGFESHLIENRVKERVYAHGQVTSKSNPRRSVGALVSISPKELAGNHNYTVKLDPQTPSNQALEVRMHREMVDAGFESEADAIEALGGNWDEVNRQRLFESFTKLPEVQQRIFERAQQKLGWADAQELQKTREELALADAQAQSQQGAMGDTQGGLGAVGAVVDPAMGNMPAVPTPQGSISGVGPDQRAAVQSGAGGLPASLPGQGSVQSPPAGHVPLPGQ